LDYKIPSLKPTTDKIQELLQENQQQESLKYFQLQLSKSDMFKDMAVNLGEWKRKSVDKNKALKLILKVELTTLNDFFSERNIQKFYLNGKAKSRNIVLEIIGLFFGVFMIGCGINDEINHNYFQMDSSLIDIKPGFSSCLYGLILIICCGSLVYTKRFKK
jgi:hypothetical protein